MIVGSKGLTSIDFDIPRPKTKHLLHDPGVEGVNVGGARTKGAWCKRTQRLGRYRHGYGRGGRAREACRGALNLVARVRGDITYWPNAVRGAQLEVGAALV